MKEIWKDVVNHENFYEVSNLGRIRSKDRFIGKRFFSGKILSTKQKNKNLYEKVSMGDGCGNVKYYKVHQVVARAFIPKPDEANYYEVNHIDGNKHNNKVENLEWMTRKENINHNFNLGTILLGEKHQNTKYKEKDIIKIKKLIKKGYRNIEIEKITGINHKQISKVRNKEVWKHLEI